MKTHKVSSTAQVILKDKGLGRSIPVPVKELARNEWVDVQILTTASQFDGRLELCAGKPSIFINDHGRGIEYPRVRFTLAHEFGHFFLHRRWLSSRVAFHDRELLVGDNLATVEHEANAFAAECLLPERFVQNFLSGTYISLVRVQDLAERAQASLKATAIRIANITPSRCCFFLEAGGSIQWAAPSDDWKYTRFPWVYWKGKLPSQSHANREYGTFAEREVSLQAWCPNSRGREEPLFESALETGYGRLLLVVDGSTESFLS